MTTPELIIAAFFAIPSLVLLLIYAMAVGDL